MILFSFGNASVFNCTNCPLRSYILICTISMSEFDNASYCICVLWLLADSRLQEV